MSAEPPDVKPQPPPGAAAQPHEVPPLRRSEFGVELARLPESIRRRYGIVTPVLVALDAIVSFSWAFMDETDTRDWAEQLDDVASQVMEGYDLSNDEMREFLARLGETTDVTAYFAMFPKKDFRRFFKRLVGAAAYHRLTVAFNNDSPPVVSVSRLALSAVAPYVVAWDDLTAELTDVQLKAFQEISQSRGKMLPMMASLLRLIDSTFNHLDIPEAWTARASVRSVGADEIDALRAELRELAASRSREAMQELSATLNRKLMGAKDALLYSADSVSQAANSLIELLDRLFRVFDHDEVLSWLDENHLDGDGTTHKDPKSGKALPTKRGQALCLVHAARPVPTDLDTDMQTVAAIAITRTRNTLQGLKHADQGTTEEMDEVMTCMQEIESFFFLLTSVTWRLADDTMLDKIRLRLDPQRVARPASAQSA